MQNPQQILIETQFEGLTLYVRPNETHEWLMETKLVAEGYGVSESAIRQHKKRNETDLKEFKHYLYVTNSHAQNTTIELGSMVREQIFWTKRGVIRLGFFIKSDRARLFRDWAEDLIIRELEKKEEQNHYLDVIAKLEMRMFTYLDALNDKINRNHTEVKELIHELTIRVDKLENIMRQPHEIGDRKAYIYLLRKVGTNEYKIGKSIDPNFRQKKFIDGGANLDLIFCKVFPNESIALSWENLLHRIFQEKQIRGEWFLFTKQDAEMTKQVFKFLENIY